MIITEMFYTDLSGKNFCQKILRSKNFNQKLRHEVVEAEEIQKLPLPLLWLCPIQEFHIVCNYIYTKPKQQFYKRLHTVYTKREVQLDLLVKVSAPGSLLGLLVYASHVIRP